MKRAAARRIERRRLLALERDAAAKIIEDTEFPIEAARAIELPYGHGTAKVAARKRDQ